MLDLSIKSQVTNVFQLLEGNYTFEVNYDPTRSDANELVEFIKKETKILPVVAPLARSSYKARESFEAISRS